VNRVRQRFGLLAAVTIALLIGSVWIRVSSESRRELGAAERHRADGRILLAVEHYRRALRWSYPMSSSKEVAGLALESIALELEEEGDPQGALLAWRSLSGGLAAARFLYSGEDPRREKADAQIARLMAQDRAPGIDAGSSEEQLAADHRRLLSERVSPSPWWGSLLLLGMTGWIVALLILVRRGFDSSGRFRWAGARAPLCGAVIGFVSFALGLLFA